MPCAVRCGPLPISASSILTIYSFSSENWSQARSGSSFLLELLRRFIRQDVAELHRVQCPHHA